MPNDKKSEITVPCSRLVVALDYVEFLNLAWKNDRRKGWEFIQPEQRFNPHGFAANRARGIMERFQLCWVPLYESGFNVPMVHKILLAARAQGAEFLVPISGMVEDLASSTHIHSLSASVFKRDTFGDPNAYDFEKSLRRFFGAFACGEIIDRDL
ncbi:MAG: hypothetical protein RDU25_00595 [Patescibacteria group bacterium]|nr:hypothetical protein [Patescibacteria group bacterium]